MAEAETKRLTLAALFLLVPGFSLLLWWTWQGMEDNLATEVNRIRRVEALGASQVVDNLGSELFHLQYTFSRELYALDGSLVNDWPRTLESVIATYREQAHYPALLAEAYLVVEPHIGLRRWVRWSSEGWLPASRPDWVPLTATLFGAERERPLDLDEPFLVFKLPDWRQFHQVLLIRFSTDVVLETIVPDLVRRSFDNAGPAGFTARVARQLTGVLAPSGETDDLIIPLVPKLRFSEWLRNYLDRVSSSPRALEEVYPGVSRWVLKVKMDPSGLASHVAKRRMGNAFWIGGLVLVLVVGFGLILVSLRQLTQASQRERAFSSLVSHELKTPLAAIQALSENLIDGVVVQPERIKEYGAALMDQSRRLNELVVNILALSVLDLPGGALRKENFDAAELAKEVGGRAGINVGVGPGPWMVRGNRAALRAALDNLVTNAQRHGAREGEAALVAIGLYRRRARGRYWVGIGVTDHGPGVPPAHLRKLFEPYRRGRQAGEKQTPGGGVGLSLVRATLRHLGGQIQVKPVPGGGLTFTLWLKEGESL